MKKILGLFAVSLLLVSASLAVVNVDVGIKTGDAELDLHLKSTSDMASTPAGMNEAHKYIARNYSISEKEISFLRKQGYTLGQIEYFAMLARQSGQPVNKIVALRSKGVGWGVLAHRLGVKPSALRKLIVKKAVKMETRSKVVKPPFQQPRGGPSKSRGR